LPLFSPVHKFARREPRRSGRGGGGPGGFAANADGDLLELLAKGDHYLGGLLGMLGGAMI